MAAILRLQRRRRRLQGRRPVPVTLPNGLGPQPQQAAGCVHALLHTTIVLARASKQLPLKLILLALKARPLHVAWTSSLAGF
jgi:hypothetical protein